MKSGGIIIVVGHTPILLSSPDFARHDDLELKQCVGVINDQNIITLFQYYVLKVK